MKKHPLSFLVLFGAFVLFSPHFVMGQEPKETIGNFAQEDSEERLRSLEEELKMLTGRMENLEHQIRMLQKSLEGDRAGALGKDPLIQDGDKIGTAAGILSSRELGTEGRASTQEGKGEKDAYQAALLALKRHELIQARKLLIETIKAKSIHAPDAMYIIALSYKAEKKYTPAIKWLELCIKTYPRSVWEEKSLIKLVECLQKSGKTEEAEVWYKKLKKFAKKSSA